MATLSICVLLFAAGYFMAPALINLFLFRGGHEGYAAGIVRDASRLRMYFGLGMAVPVLFARLMWDAYRKPARESGGVAVLLYACMITGLLAGKINAPSFVADPPADFRAGHPVNLVIGNTLENMVSGMVLGLAAGYLVVRLLLRLRATREARR